MPLWDSHSADAAACTATLWTTASRRWKHAARSGAAGSSSALAARNSAQVQRATRSLRLPSAVAAPLSSRLPLRSVAEAPDPAGRPRLVASRSCVEAFC